ncbi:hypothetical protein HanOQP8_Chr02g0041481 [Helianthus annuus]|nr:hypothetical protein HanOQP8_Chr02g0041481 [Helianthus annuus]
MGDCGSYLHWSVQPVLVQPMGNELATGPIPSPTSPVIGSNETTPTKRPRKKKVANFSKFTCVTLAELREDETRLLKERKQLKRQLASLQATCQKHRKDNESLKKMKVKQHPLNCI